MALETKIVALCPDDLYDLNRHLEKHAAEDWRIVGVAAAGPNHLIYMQRDVADEEIRRNAIGFMTQGTQNA